MNRTHLLARAPRQLLAGPRRAHRRRKFGSMFLSQVPTIPGLEVTLIADLDIELPGMPCRAVGWTRRIGRHPLQPKR